MSRRPFPGDPLPHIPDVPPHPDRVEIGRALHKMFCSLAHEDQCAWYYDIPPESATYQRWYVAADRFMAFVEMEVANDDG